MQRKGKERICDAIVRKRFRNAQRAVDGNPERAHWEREIVDHGKSVTHQGCCLRIIWAMNFEAIAGEECRARRALLDARMLDSRYRFFNFSISVALFGVETGRIVSETTRFSDFRNYFTTGADTESLQSLSDRFGRRGRSASHPPGINRDRK